MCGTKANDGAIFCSKCGSNLQKGQPSDLEVKEIRSESNISFFSISNKRLALFSVITFGLYEIFWFYKNWSAVKMAEGKKIAPFWRAIFAVFFCHSLFKKVLESAKSHSYTKSYSPGWLAAGYIIILFINNALSKAESTDISTLLLLLFSLISFLPLLPVQNAINYNNEQLKGAMPLKHGFSGGEVTIIVVGIIWFFLVLVGTFSA